MAGAPKGNTNASKAKPWTEAIKRAIARYDSDKPEELKFLNKLADQLLVNCINGDFQANLELTTRLDGKPAQTTVLAGDEDNPVAIAEVRRVIVNP